MGVGVTIYSERRESGDRWTATVDERNVPVFVPFEFNDRLVFDLLFEGFSDRKTKYRALARGRGLPKRLSPALKKHIRYRYSSDIRHASLTWFTAQELQDFSADDSSGIYTPFYTALLSHVPPGPDPKDLRFIVVAL
ncbi:MAG: hypothetical protein QNK04_09260 [Myxococcota bacterium]|nr:hypothetical protein [Myxococcota bacterium]